MLLFFVVAYPLPYTKTNFKGGIADFNAKRVIEVD